MEAQACGHVFMHPTQRLQATAEALDSIGLEDINSVTRGKIVIYLVQNSHICPPHLVYIASIFVKVAFTVKRFVGLFVCAIVV